MKECWVKACCWHHVRSNSTTYRRLNNDVMKQNGLLSRQSMEALDRVFWDLAATDIYTHTIPTSYFSMSVITASDINLSIIVNDF